MKNSIFNYGILLTAIMLVIISISCTEDDPATLQEEHAEAFGLVILDHDTAFFRVFKGQVTSNRKELTLTQDISSDYYTLKFLDSAGNPIDLTGDKDKSLNWQITDPTIFGIEKETGKEWSIRMTGFKKGSSELVIQVFHGDHPDFISPKIKVNVI